MKAHQITDPDRIYYCFDIWAYYIYQGRVTVYDQNKLIQSAQVKDANLGSPGFIEIQPMDLPNQVLNDIGWRQAGSTLTYKLKKTGLIKQRFNGYVNKENYEYIKTMAGANFKTFNQQLDEVLETARCG